MFRQLALLPTIVVFFAVAWFSFAYRDSGSLIAATDLETQISQIRGLTPVQMPPDPGPEGKKCLEYGKDKNKNHTECESPYANGASNDCDQKGCAASNDIFGESDECGSGIRWEGEDFDIWTALASTSDLEYVADNQVCWRRIKCQAGDFQLGIVCSAGTLAEPQQEPGSSQTVESEVGACRDRVEGEVLLALGCRGCSASSQLWVEEGEDNEKFITTYSTLDCDPELPPP